MEWVSYLDFGLGVVDPFDVESCAVFEFVCVCLGGAGLGVRDYSRFVVMGVNVRD